MSRNPTDNAFPVAISEDQMVEDGLTVREWYAGHALTGLLACNGERLTPQYAASKAFAYADAMIAEAAKGAS